MFSAKFLPLLIHVNLCRGPSQVCNDHSQLGAFCPQGAKKTLFGPKIRYIQILCHGDVRNRHRNTIFGRKHLQIVRKATVYDLGAFRKQIPYTHAMSHCVPKMMKNRPPRDMFMSEINIYKPFEMNDIDSFPNRKLPKAISF